MRADRFRSICRLNFLDQYLEEVSVYLEPFKGYNLQCVEETENNSPTDFFLNTLEPGTATQELLKAIHFISQTLFGKRQEISNILP